ncbi:MAG: hypothetical protein Aseana_31190 [Candidatus Pelagadaptatus aseana]|uniref:helix-turn-helix domain-containing protein n=1 Tax=Candidatus Pelagadaptatus aseana TaxID=3120508 RepID=UPI0039B209E0
MTDYLISHFQPRKPNIQDAHTDRAGENSGVQQFGNRAYCVQIFRQRVSTADELKKLVIYIIINKLEGQLKLSSVANYLCLSERTVTRRLNNCDLKYRDIIEEVKFYLSVKYLLASPVNIAEIARMVGYANPSNFCKAFKRWSGVTPLKYRILNRQL